ncbi:SDR family NAD(P)-dependent oxidoreductase [Acidisphaera sp. L21]|uniref:SDR family NAD(P)-dependent oxidoreductase n=1 Tax=Acidisphaera sp. L21 TaxID=1641851 RepID=UPI00131D56E9|nr:SDR family NAD(P)-dependent oxidoreductase [Acidisphaera sp. L21]
MQLLIFGLGYTGTALAREAAADGWTVSVATRQTDAAPPAGVTLVPFDMADRVLADVTHLVATAAPGEDGDPVLARHAVAIAAAPALRWIGYLSTTGVYGDRGGGWVDEATEPASTSERGRRRVAAERAWTAARPGAAVDLMRLAGIYGPGRSVLDDLRAGRARRVDKPGHLFGRIHREDISGALLAAMAQDRPAGPRVLHGADDEPAASADVIAEAARLLGREPPALIPFAEAEPTMSPMARSFWADNRRVRSAVTQAALGRRWRYPTYREGLRAVLTAEGGL